MEFKHVVSGLINCAYCVKPHIKILDTEARRNFLLGERTR